MATHQEVAAPADDLSSSATGEPGLADAEASPANGHELGHRPEPDRPEPEPEPVRKPRRRHLVLDVTIITGVAVVYALSLLGYHALASRGGLPEPDVSRSANTVVLVRLEKLDTVANRLDVKVLVMPDDSMIDKRLNVLTVDTSVRFFPHNDLGDLAYPVGKSPAQVSTNIEAHGDPGNWPFDGYHTDTIQADVLVGTGSDRQYKPARVEVTGSLEGWDVSVDRVGRNSADTDRPDNIARTMSSSSCSGPRAGWSSTWASVWCSSPCRRWHCLWPFKC